MQTSVILNELEISYRIPKLILRKKFNDWVKSIDSKAVRELVEQNSIITGGVIASLLLKEPINDFDIYFTNYETAKAVTEYYVNKFNELNSSESDNATTAKPNIYETEEKNGEKRIKIMVKSAGVVSEKTNTNDYQFFENTTIKDDVQEDYLENVFANILDNADESDVTEISKPNKYKPVFLSNNAITLSDKVQLVIRFYGNADEIHENYDFIHCTSYWTSCDSNLVIRKGALESLLARRLYYIGSKYPVCSFIRCRKFLKNGWHIDAGQMLKICFQISELDLTKIDVLEDQLTGVDTAYFLQLIEWLKQKASEEENFHLKLPYLYSLIDKLF
jgi:hypothetical protein